MTLTVVELKKPAPANKADMIRQLEYALEHVRSNEIKGVVIVLNWVDGDTGHLFSGTQTVSTVGRLEYAKMRVLKFLDEQT